MESDYACRCCSSSSNPRAGDTKLRAACTRLNLDHAFRSLICPELNVPKWQIAFSQRNVSTRTM